MAWSTNKAAPSLSDRSRVSFSEIVRRQQENNDDDDPESQVPQVAACPPPPLLLSQEEDDLALALALQALDASDDADAEMEQRLRLENARAAGLPESKIRIKVTKAGVEQPSHAARGATLVYTERIYRLEGDISIRASKGKPKY